MAGWLDGWVIGWSKVVRLAYTWISIWTVSGITNPRRAGSSRYERTLITGGPLPLGLAGPRPLRAEACVHLDLNLDSVEGYKPSTSGA